MRVYRRKPGGAFHYEIRSSEERRRIDPPIFDAREARRWAHARAEELEEGSARLATSAPSLQLVFDAYLANRTPRKRSRTSREADHRMAELWLRRLGSNRAPYDIRLEEWESFIEDRRAGRICPHGLHAPHGEGVARCAGPRPVRARTVQADCLFPHRVFTWAARWRTPGGWYLLRENPVRGFPLPADPSPRQPVASTDRFDAVMPHAAGRGYLDELLPIVVGTGHRITAVLKLRYSDLRLKDGPFGSIRWRPENDKEEIERIVPMNPQTRAAVDLALSRRSGIGDAWLFPGLRAKKRPTSRFVASHWLRDAEEAAGLEKLDGSLWHSYRRGWATARKHLPDADVAFVGGWQNERTYRASYTKPDRATILRVVLEPAELREIREA